MTLPVLQSVDGEFPFSATHPWSGITKPAGTAAGDLLIVCLQASANVPGWITPAGWNLWGTQNVGGFAFSDTIFWRVADGTEGASFSFDSSGNLTGSAYIARVTGVHPTNPIHASSSVGMDSSTSGSIVIPSLTTTVDDCLLVEFGGFSSASTRNWTTSDPPTKVFDDTSISNQMEVWKESFATHGATGTRTFALGTTVNRTWIMLAIAPPNTNPTTGQLFPRGYKTNGGGPTTGQLFPRAVIQ